MPSKSTRPWSKYRARFDKREWETVEQMSRALKVPLGTCRRNCKGWHEDREEIERAARVEFKELAAHENAQVQLDIYRDIKPMLQELFLKGINQLLAKKRNPLTGEMEAVPFSSEATALGASRFGLAGLKLLETGVLPGGGGGNPLIIDGDMLNNGALANLDPKNFTADQLRAAIASIDTEEGVQEATTDRAAPKERGARKRS